jgi:hypothetical protein
MRCCYFCSRGTSTSVIGRAIRGGAGVVGFGEVVVNGIDVPKVGMALVAPLRKREHIIHDELVHRLRSFQALLAPISLAL